MIGEPQGAVGEEPQKERREAPRREMVQPSQEPEEDRPVDTENFGEEPAEVPAEEPDADVAPSPEEDT